MADQRRKKVVAVLHDLMFQVKIEQAARRAGFEPVFVQSQEEALARAKEKPAVIILDLNDRGIEPLETITKLKGDFETSRLKLLGYVSHVQTDLQKAALDRGCDVVIARSALSQRLPAMLEQFK
jgi:PleD family two-component response regulator